ncbi:hypothetical protein JCM18899A_50700 [Nocardioides sp. AN3]
MYPSAKARELTVLLRISRDLDVCGDLTATVDNPAELIAWASLLTDPTVLAWRAQDSGCRFVHVGADHHRAPIRGHVTAVLSCEQHPEFWDALHLDDIEAGGTRRLSVHALAKAWEAMPIIPPDSPTTTEPPSPPPDASSTGPGRDRGSTLQADREETL